MTNLNDKRTASQRIDDLERAVMSLFQVSQNQSRENTMIKDALKLMNGRVTALIQLLEKMISNGVSESSVDEVVKANQILELQAKVQNLIEQGFFQPADTVDENSFVVGYEAEPAAEDGTPGKIINPRLQCTVASLAKEVQEQLNGHKTGDFVTFKKDALVFNVQEIYKIVNPTPPAAPEIASPVETAPVTEQIATETAAETTEAAPQSSSDAASAATPATSDIQVAGN